MEMLNNIPNSEEERLVGPNLIRNKLFCPYCSDPNCKDASHQELGTWFKLDRVEIRGDYLGFFEQYICPNCNYKTERIKIMEVHNGIRS